MSAQITLDAQSLHRLRRDCIALLQREASESKSVDPEKNHVDALVFRFKTNVDLPGQYSNSSSSQEIMLEPEMETVATRELFIWGVLKIIISITTNNFYLDFYNS